MHAPAGRSAQQSRAALQHQSPFAIDDDLIADHDPAFSSHPRPPARTVAEFDIDGDTKVGNHQAARLQGRRAPPRVACGGLAVVSFGLTSLPVQDMTPLVSLLISER